jgi:hypothetical protein
MALPAMLWLRRLLSEMCSFFMLCRSECSTELRMACMKSRKTLRATLDGSWTSMGMDERVEWFGACYHSIYRCLIWLNLTIRTEQLSKKPFYFRATECCRTGLTSTITYACSSLNTELVSKRVFNIYILENWSTRIYYFISNQCFAGINMNN